MNQPHISVFHLLVENMPPKKGFGEDPCSARAIRSDYLFIVYICKLYVEKHSKSYHVRRWLKSPTAPDSALTDDVPNPQTTQGSAGYIPIKRTCKLLHPHINGDSRFYLLGATGE